MGSRDPYRIQIKFVTPEIIDLDELFQPQIHMKNIGSVPFSGGSIDVIMSWPELPRPYLVSFYVPIGPIQVNEEITVNLSQQRPMSSGYTIFNIARDSFMSTDGNEIHLFGLDGSRLSSGKVVHGFRVRSPEEIYSKRFVESSERLIESSSYIEKLTFGLIFVTYMLVSIAVNDSLGGASVETIVITDLIIVVASLVLTFLTTRLMKRIRI